jgi:tRNA dimethylallyltransferase
MMDSEPSFKGAPTADAQTIEGPLIAVVGPTAVGKSALALRLSRTFGGEIVSADSRQIYRFMDIGTAKPTAEEQSLVPHHLINIVEPNQEYTLAQYQRDAYQTINDIIRRDLIPFLVGGTGLYVRAVLKGLGIPEVAPNQEFRSELERRAADQGAEALHEELRRIDPQAADEIDWRNVRRVIRALEVYHASGRPISELRASHPPRYRICTIGLTVDRSELYRRVDERVDKMIAEGLIAEVRSLVERGYGENATAMSGLGYRQIIAYLKGDVDLDQAVETIKTDTHRFVRQQYTWFRLNDPSIHWFEAYPETQAEIIDFVGRWLEEPAIQ